MSDKKDYSIFSGPKFADSMRSSGYRDTSYAVAELVDNSIDAKAKHVQILCQEKFNFSTNRYSLDMIAVLDDGNGMDENELRSSLLFGDGTRGTKQTEIGKFGMGLPNSSLSQCRKVEVYSWQNSSKPMYSYLDYDEVRGGEKCIPAPKEKKLPSMLAGVIKKFPRKSGTLVVWSNLDRCSWTTSKTIMAHSRFLIGRIYRKYLHKKKLTIDMITLKVKPDGKILESKSEQMLPNDPMYLMAPSSTPNKWGKEPMFKEDTKPKDVFSIDFEGQKHNITVRYSIEKDELRSPEKVHGEQGNTDHGQHARKNMGISIIRSDREITLDVSLLMSSEPRDRWWGVEIEIPASLDYAVGLTNNKQHVDILSAMMSTVGQFAEDDSGESEIIDELSEQDRTRAQLLKMVKEITSRIRSMRNRIRATRLDTRKKRKKGKTMLEDKIEAGIKQEEKEGKTSQSDKSRTVMKKEERISVIVDALKADGRDEENAKKTAILWVEEDKKIVFEESVLDGSNFFSVKNLGGILQIKINSDHRAYKNLLLLTNSEEYTDMDSEEKLKIIHDGMWLLLASWARFEDLIDNNKKRRDVQDIRYDWGKELDVFLEQNVIG